MAQFQLKYIIMMLFLCYGIRSTPPNTSSYTGKYIYHYKGTRFTWEGAQSFCADTYNSDLATVLNEDDLNEVRRVIDLVPVCGWVAGFIGLNDRDIEGTFRWIDGTDCFLPNTDPLCSPWWESGEPNNVGDWTGDDADCVIMNPDRSQGYTREFRCDLTYAGFVCNAPDATESYVVDRSSMDYIHELNTRVRWTSSMLPDVFFQNYRSWNEYEAMIDYLLITYPSITSKGILGQTVEGRQIPIITLSTSDQPKQALYIQAAVHANEWLANSAVMYILNGLCEGYASNDNEITEILNSINIYIVPTVNIDGYIYTWEVEPWRKNRRDNGDGSFGVDINRNFDGPEGTWCIPGGASTNPCSNSYCGPYPFSEPEAQATKNFIFDVEGNIRHNIVATVDMHIRGPNILYPWAWSTEHIPQPYYGEYIELSQAISDAIYDVHGVRYEPTDDFNGGFSAGTMRDYPFAISNGYIFSFTWEGRDPGQLSELDTTHIIPAGQEQLAGILTLAQWIMDRPSDSVSSDSVSSDSDESVAYGALFEPNQMDNNNNNNEEDDTSKQYSVTIHLTDNVMMNIWILLLFGGLFVFNIYFVFFGIKKMRSKNSFC